MAFQAVLDANVLFPASLRDTLLRLAELEFFDPLWSERILDEMMRNLIKNRGLTPQQAQQLADAMNGAFEDAAVDGTAIEGLESSMTNDEKDRHVLATAVARDAGAVVTNNVKHFPAEACDPHGVDINTADEFLCSLFDLNPDVVCRVLQEQAAALTKPPHTLEDLLGHLEAGGAESFVDRVRQHV